jgi:hypothetical protein
MKIKKQLCDKTLSELECIQSEDTFGYSDEQLREWIISIIKDIQKGSGIDREVIPESVRGEIAKNKWNDATFTYGMEYGAIAILMKMFEITEKDLCKHIMSTHRSYCLKCGASL